MGLNPVLMAVSQERERLGRTGQEGPRGAGGWGCESAGRDGRAPKAGQLSYSTATKKRCPECSRVR